MNWFSLSLCFGCFLWFILLPSSVEAGGSVSASSHFSWTFTLWWWDTCWDKVPVKSSRVDLENLPFPCWSVSFFVYPWCIFAFLQNFLLWNVHKMLSQYRWSLQWKNHPPKKTCPFYPFPQKRFWILSRWFFLFQFGGIRDSFPAEVFCLMRKFAPWVYLREVWQGEKWVVKLESWD